MVSVPFTSGSSLQLVLSSGVGVILFQFQFPLHRDPRCNLLLPGLPASCPGFQFPLHRDPRCNQPRSKSVEAGNLGFSSLYIGILAATRYSLPVQLRCLLKFQFPLHRDPRCNNNDSRFAIREVGMFQFPLHRDPRCNGNTSSNRPQIKSFSSLYIGILAATFYVALLPVSLADVSVPFTSGSSLQRDGDIRLEKSPLCDVSVPFTSGSSLQLYCVISL